MEFEYSTRKPDLRPIIKQFSCYLFNDSKSFEVNFLVEFGWVVEWYVCVAQNLHPIASIAIGEMEKCIVHTISKCDDKFSFQYTLRGKVQWG